MSPSDDDPNPWLFGSEMTINGGCQGWRSSAPASSANSSSKPGKPPATDRQPTPEDSIATTGTSRHSSTRKNRKNSGDPDATWYAFDILREEIDSHQYVPCNGSRPRAPSSVLSRGYLEGNFPGQGIRRPDVPRSVCPQLCNELLAEYYASINTDLADVKTQEQDLTASSNLETVTPHQGTNDLQEPKDQRGANAQHGTPKQQDAPDMKDPAVEYRQFDKDQDPKQDADTDEESS